MIINRQRTEFIKEVISSWGSNKNIKIKFVERGGANTPEFGVEGDNWGIEVLIEDGWAYLNGYNGLEASTTVSEEGDIPDSFDRLLTYVSKN